MLSPSLDTTCKCVSCIIIILKQYHQFQPPNKGLQKCQSFYRGQEAYYRYRYLQKSTKPSTNKTSAKYFRGSTDLSFVINHAFPLHIPMLIVVATLKEEYEILLHKEFKHTL